MNSLRKLLRIDLKKTLNEYTLELCRRCPKSHIELVNHIIPHIKPLPDAQLGTITYLTWNKATGSMEPGHLVICRYNLPLLRLCHELITVHKHPVHILGEKKLRPQLEAFFRDMQTHITEQSTKTKIDVGTYVLRQNEILFNAAKEKLLSSGQPASIPYYEELYELKKWLWNTFSDFENIFEFLTDIFKKPSLDKASNDDKTKKTKKQKREELQKTHITLATIHGSKGATFSTAWVLVKDHSSAVSLQRTVGDGGFSDGEKNLIYVASTRSKESLNFVTCEASVFPVLRSSSPSAGELPAELKLHLEEHAQSHDDALMPSAKKSQPNALPKDEPL